MNIPANIAFEKAKQDLIKCVNISLNSYKVPFFEMEYLLRDVLNEVAKHSQEAYQIALKDFTTAQAETSEEVILNGNS